MDITEKIDPIDLGAMLGIVCVTVLAIGGVISGDDALKGIMGLVGIIARGGIEYAKKQI